MAIIAIKEVANKLGVTQTVNGSWIAAIADFYGAPLINGNWWQSIAVHLGATTAKQGSWLIAICDQLGITEPVNGSWLVAWADNDPSPSASFTTDVNYNKINEEFTFTNTSSNSDTYGWTFGDGDTSTLTNPTHTYTTPADFTVELTASDGGVDPSTTSQVLSVYDYSIDFTTSDNQLEVTFTNTTTSSNILIDSYEWDFGDGNTSTDTNPVHTYAADGTYTVNLVTYFTIDGDTISGGTNKQVSVSNIPNVTSLTTTDIQPDQFTYSFDPEPSMDGYNVEYKEVGGTVSNNNNSLTVTGLTAETNYEYRVQWYLGTYNGSWSSWIPVLTTPEPTFVEATGGTVTTITDGGVNYKVHTFSSGGTFDVTSGGVIEYLVVGRGANGGNGTGNSSSGGGGSGGQVLSLNEGISVSSYTISIGSTTSFNGQSLGTGGGVGGGSPVSGSSNGNSGSNGTTSDINGSSYTYGSSGGSGASQVFAGRSTTYYGGGGGSGAGNGAHVYRYDGSCESGGSANGYGGGGGGGSAGRASSCNGPGGSGNNGVVIIRYETE